MNSTATRCLKRLQKEKEDFTKFQNLILEVDSTNQFIWRVSFQGAEETLYTDEYFTLQFKFTEEYVLKLLKIFYSKII